MLDFHPSDEPGKGKEYRGNIGKELTRAALYLEE
jgi:hypothetical protein